MLVTLRVHTRIQMSVVALRRQEVVHKAAVVHILALVDRTIAAAAAVRKPAAVARIEVATADCMATEEEVGRIELAEEVDRIELAEMADRTETVEVAEDDRKDSAQREIGV